MFKRLWEEGTETQNSSAWPPLQCSVPAFLWMTGVFAVEAITLGDVLLMPQRSLWWWPWSEGCAGGTGTREALLAPGGQGAYFTPRRTRAGSPHCTRGLPLAGLCPQLG